MNNFKYETQGTYTYLVYTMDESESVDTMSLGMITNNKIPGLASTVFTQMNTAKYLKFNITSKISVKQFFSGVVNKKRLLGVFSGIVNAMISAEDYMIDINSIILDLEYIFTDVSTCETVLICLPVVRNKSEKLDFCSFFKNIIFSTQFDQTENCDHVAKIINYLNSSTNFSIYDFKNILDEIKSGKVSVAAPAAQAVPQQPMPQSPVQQQAPVQMPKQPVNQAPQQPIPQAPVQMPKQPAPKKHGKQPLQQPAKGAAPMPVPGAPRQPIPQGGMKKPGQPAVPPAAPGGANNAQAGAEKEISLMYLLQHYNSENAAAYKAQKAAKKANKGNKKGAAPAAPVAQPVPGAPAMPNKMNGKAAPVQMPNQPAPGNFAVPGQQPQFMPNQQPVKQPVGVGAGMAAPVNAPAAPQMQQPQPVSQPQNMPGGVNQHGGFIPPVQQPAQPQGGMNFGDTTVLGGGGNYGETTVLNPGQAAVQAPMPHLIRLKNNERIPINKPVLRIGKERSYVDYFIADNTAISRSHANIITRGNECFIIDTNSTNHTFVNGVMIQSNVETKLNNGDSVRLANENFDFKIL